MYIFEIGVEELPTTEVNNILLQLEEKLEKFFKEEELRYSGLTVFYAPRRFGFFIKKIDEKQKDKTIEKRGPSKTVAFDENGNPTKALNGFLKSNNASIKDIEIRNNYVFLSKKVEGKKTEELLKEKIPQIIYSLNFRKSMKWGNGEFSFVRIPHWILSVYKGEILEIELFGIKASNKTYGHRFVDDNIVEVKSIEDYLENLRRLKVIALHGERKEKVLSLLKNYETSFDEGLIDEVVTLTEYPILLEGRFLEKYLSLPEELITTTIKHHQRSFTVYKGEKITNKFLSFIDSPNGNVDLIKKGYEKVVNARLEDAKYYYEKDLKVPLESFNESLKEIVFQKSLGTLMDKVERIEKISEKICEELKIDYSDKKRVLRTAHLCKADIASSVVYEFPELQGVMGRIYALKDGEDYNVALGIEEHYSDVPKNITGAIVAIADRVDTVVGNFIVGNIPSGSKDPFGIRKKVDTLFEIPNVFSWDIDLLEVVKFSAELFGKGIPNELFEFFEARYEVFNSNTRYDIARAVKRFWKRPLRGRLIAQALMNIVDKEEFQSLLIGFERVHNISSKFDSCEFDSTKFLDNAEKELFNKYIELKPRILEALDNLSFDAALLYLVEFRKYIDSYFDNVFVMTKQDDIRMNRLGFLKSLDRLFLKLGDLNLLKKK
ncbi:glycyl-tRNA synthetase subunit beta [Thermosipho melanesiensis]|uniref:Glycine--tRNA ligase beta subunit n=2 Tax=Thermosipho melanesiensis TaxID=46541 RepID=A6LKP5_THEM4|nr:glycine--tRNA ligase subunit beta [Thermosipho melanesiensis]ABR30496.1 Glycine--tRNA ligase [Thermosipho melanesiensis BI429]APT73647.1 glycyl-tRNA synthetase subunit beta [Thermosipho melanesiensis]OOC35589.1 glycyl-tRNA synthetase subunit beta [Thermosipho melanesiensis]OOC39263.1 glycyl-tRNA synthetase subunit beta [Thermosipho melanesiensis]OOC39349.1 glycyl-tRNA synthetase subunit beta [Thermosipho melanesiensis]